MCKNETTKYSNVHIIFFEPLTTKAEDNHSGNNYYSKFQKGANTYVGFVYDGDNIGAGSEFKQIKFEFFCSHIGKDIKGFIRELKNRSGVSMFLDETDAQVGETNEAMIVRNLDASSKLLLFLTENTFHYKYNEWLVFELKHCISTSKPILCVNMSVPLCLIPEEYQFLTKSSMIMYKVFDDQESFLRTITHKLGLRSKIIERVSNKCGVIFNKETKQLISKFPLSIFDMTSSTKEELDVYRLNFISLLTTTNFKLIDIESKEIIAEVNNSFQEDCFYKLKILPVNKEKILLIMISHYYSLRIVNMFRIDQQLLIDEIYDTKRATEEAIELSRSNFGGVDDFTVMNIVLS